jgi:hypothetical protein
LAQVILSLLAASLVGAIEPPLVARVEWEFEGAILQSAVVFRDETVQLVRNSNFLCGPVAEARLGKAEIPYDDGLKIMRVSLRQIAARARPEASAAKSDPPPRSHRSRVYLGERELTGHAVYGPAVTQALERLCRRFQDTVKGPLARAVTPAPPAGKTRYDDERAVERVGGSAPGTFPIRKAGCRRTRRSEQGETWACPIPGEGWAWLSYPLHRGAGSPVKPLDRASAPPRPRR